MGGAVGPMRKCLSLLMLALLCLQTTASGVIYYTIMKSSSQTSFMKTRMAEMCKLAGNQTNSSIVVEYLAQYFDYWASLKKQADIPILIQFEHESFGRGRPVGIRFFPAIVGDGQYPTLPKID